MENNNLEQEIMRVMTKKMTDGTIEKAIEEYFIKGVNKALDNAFCSYGDGASKVIEEKIKSVMMPFLQSYDYSNYIVKLDTVLTEILKTTTIEHKTLLTNFKKLMIDTEQDGKIQLSKLFNEWQNYVAGEINTSNLEVCYDDGISYENAIVSLEIDRHEEKSWSSFKHATISFECEQDEEVNFQFNILKYKNEEWGINYNKTANLTSLKYLNGFEIFMMNLSQKGTVLEIDTSDYEESEVEVEAEPEASFN